MPMRAAGGLGQGRPFGVREPWPGRLAPAFDPPSAGKKRRQLVLGPPEADYAE